VIPVFEHDERELELATLDLLADLGWATADGSTETFPDGMFGRQRASKHREQRARLSLSADTRLGWEFDLWGVAGDEVLFVQQRPHVATE